MIDFDMANKADDLGGKRCGRIDGTFSSRFKLEMAGQEHEVWGCEGDRGC
jgi:hypothetical protein